ncbi:MAG: hypothetical protein R3E42_04425 [Burkholderiaceae bacterium]
MSLSDTLSGLNAALLTWVPEVHDQAANGAGFDGDVYGGLEARHWARPELGWLQDLCILVACMGCCILDRMQPYRLEMVGAAGDAAGGKKPLSSGGRSWPSTSISARQQTRRRWW